MLNLSISIVILQTLVTATCYQAVPEQCDADPYVTAGEYDGMWMIADRMNRRWSNKIDLLVNNDSYVDKFANVKIVKHVRK